MAWSTAVRDLEVCGGDVWLQRFNLTSCRLNVCARLVSRKRRGGVVFESVLPLLLVGAFGRIFAAKVGPNVYNDPKDGVDASGGGLWLQECRSDARATPADRRSVRRNHHGQHHKGKGTQMATFSLLRYRRRLIASARIRGSSSFSKASSDTSTTLQEKSTSTRTNGYARPPRKKRHEPADLLLSDGCHRLPHQDRPNLQRRPARVRTAE